MQELEDLVRRRVQESIDVKRALLDLAPSIARAGDALVQAYRTGKKAIFFGNGGSAADAQHLAAELVGRYYRDRRALPALALNVNSSAVTAIANDYGYDHAFARQLEAFGQPGDVAVALSTSGNSVNVLEAVRAGKQRGMITIALTGAGGGQLAAEVDYCICMPSTDTPRIQEGHILVGHVWCEAIEGGTAGP